MYAPPVYEFGYSRIYDIIFFINAAETIGDVIFVNGHVKFYLSVHNHAENTRIYPKLFRTVLYRDLSN